MPQVVKSVGTTAVKILNSRPTRKLLIIANKHATQSCVVKVSNEPLKEDVTEVQKISFAAIPAVGTYKIRFWTSTTAAIAHNADAAAVQAALRLLPNLGEVTVSGSVAAGFVVTLALETPAVDANLPLMEVVDSTLSSSPESMVTVKTIVTETVKGSYADGYPLLPEEELRLEGDVCPATAVFAKASGPDTRIEIIEG